MKPCWRKGARLWAELASGGMLRVLQLLPPARALIPHPLLDLSSAPQAPTRHFCNEDGSLHLFPRENSSPCPPRPFLTRVAIKELIHFTGLCYSGGSSLVLNRHLHCSLAGSGGKSHHTGFIILFTSLPSLLARIMLRYGERKSVGISEKAGEAQQGQHQELSKGLQELQGKAWQQPSKLFLLLQYKAI